MLEQFVWGNTVENWAISVGIVLGTMCVTKIVSLFNKKILYKITRKTQSKLDDIIYDSLESPILFGILLLGIWIAFHRLEHAENTLKAVDGAYRILVVLNITWFFNRLFNSLINVYWIHPSDHSSKTRRQTAKMMPVIKRGILILVWIIGIITALSNVGVNISALIGTLGIGGIAFALAAQDTVKSIFGAFTILTDRPFNIGDTIRIDSHEGTIIDVGIRSTKMRNYDKRIITFPNYKIMDASIVNISAEPMRRVVTKLGLTYDTPPEKMQEALEILRAIPGKVENATTKEVIANFSEFADSALVITFIFFIEKKGNNQKVTSDVYMEILKDFNKAGLNFAFPTQTIYVEKE
ncbi:mechanosensitive ion channel family protein [Parabacteroides sp. 52]|uniref:mechanosensitive ion channel family protein n=1 Tax=unclassified Parabacteroides TaxID=2649774 RepID=UPI0013D4D8EA|nr:MULTISPECIES: mechanosensitive ion channel family protein [unclassified Parabacteroides]MDH6534476.1 MscS family membrane protein [Parabacteroides sp. PM5-20]NDV55074.1 mechanosensitive ion channel family protein [Parabacteroides sp. 52]